MGFRFRRSVRIARGIRLNVGKRGTSISLGGRGITTNFSKRGVRTTYSLPGTGVSYTSYRSSNRSSGGQRFFGVALAVVVIGAIIGALFR